jgi:hypothetical protein
MFALAHMKCAFCRTSIAIKGLMHETAKLQCVFWTDINVKLETIEQMNRLKAATFS